MFNDYVAVLDVGSNKITYSIGKNGVNGTFSFLARKTADYNAFYSKEFSDIHELEKVVAGLNNEIIAENGLSGINKIYVGVPNEFVKIQSKNYRISFTREKRITAGDLVTLFDLGYERVDSEHTLINRAAVYYAVDGNKTHDPIGLKGQSLAGRLCYISISDYYKEVFDRILKKAGIGDVNYVSSSYAESVYLFDGALKEECRILVDVGYTTTDVTVSAGDGVLFGGSIPLGGGIITAYLSDKLECDFFVAEDLKRKLNLGIINGAGRTYSVFMDGGDKQFFDVDVANDTAKTVLDEIADKIEKVISLCTLKIPSDVDVYFTGGGINLIRGAVEYTAGRLGVFPKTVAPELPHLKSGVYSSEISLLSLALRLKKDKVFFTE